MKISWRKASLWIVAGAIAIFAILQPVTHQGQIEYKVETISNTCNFDVFPDQEVRTENGDIVIVMPIQAPNPCHDVTGVATVTGNEIEVNMELVQVGEFCAQCIGTVVGQVTISDLNSGEYKIKINTPDKSLIVEDIKV